MSKKLIPLLVTTELKGVFFGYGNPTTNKVIRIEQAQMCLAPHTKVLRADLSWDRIDAIQVGDILVGFDEENEMEVGRNTPLHYRRWRLSTVLYRGVIRRPTYRLSFDDGTVVEASSEHLWLAGKTNRRWISTERLRPAFGNQGSHVVKLVSVSDEDESRDAGWLAGFFDGEGHVNASGREVTVVQKPGPECDRAEILLKERGFSVRRHLSGNGDAYLTTRGGTAEVLRFLPMVRPERLVRQAITKIMGWVSITRRSHSTVRLISKEMLGVRNVVALKTDTKTFVAEGLASHNCVYWSSDVHGVVGLAATGPTGDCKIGPPAPAITLQGVTAVMEVSKEAEAKWKAQPWK